MQNTIVQIGDKFYELTPYNPDKPAKKKRRKKQQKTKTPLHTFETRVIKLLLYLTGACIILSLLFK